MTEDIGWVELGVRPDTTGFSASLSRQVDPAMGDLGRRSATRFSAGFKRAAVGVTLGILGAATAGIRLASSSLDEARESQKVGAQTNAVLKSTGHIANVTARDIGRLANQLSRKAGIDDEVIQSSENVLLTFRGVREESGKNNDIFKQATKAALDMSVALGRDLNSSALQVGKALNDPVRGMTMLSRSGVVFTEQQKDQIKALTESGDQIGAQKVILRELTKEFQGSAKAQATESDKLNVAFLNLKESIGKELLPYMDDLQRFIRKDGIPAVHDFFGFMEHTGAPAIKKVAGFLKDAGGHVKDLIGFLKDLPDPAKYAGLIALVGGVGVAKLRGGKGGALGTAGSLLGMTKPVNVFVTNPGFGAGGGLGGGVGGKSPRLANAIPLVGSLAIGGEAFKESGIPQNISSKFFGTDDNNETFRRIVDGDTQALADLRAQMKATADYWNNFEFKADGAFNGVNKLIEDSKNHVKGYQRVLGLTPKQVTTLFKVNGIDRAVEQAKTLRSELQAAADVSRGLDNGVTFQHGGQRIYIGTANFKDGRDLVKKGQQASLGGRRP